MTYLFSEAGLAALHDFIDPATLFAFDLDGTLAPIIADPGGHSGAARLFRGRLPA